ncbi:hypothetical protein GGR28_001742 [Lewinella aquimaris]|uniref:Uncharacterized protein n=1 Tax=Neolewinella aquimaris TaxID=1835722 RepID=A0A840E678_9BACT|nr:hypothetical protein [Neolewinella aquimaris]MBB4079125.1 hypothetical protein [Neolewinella aquimaris]
MKTEEEQGNLDRPSQLKGWFDNLQQESWQLELLISGFAIFLLIAGYESLNGLNGLIQRLLLDANHWQPLAITYYIMRTAYLVLIASLVIHVLLRGIWIAAIGLRYVSGDIDYAALGYRPRYTRFLRRRIGSFDNYLEKLERLCSVVFSVAFLIIFCFFSVTAFGLFTTTLQFVLSWLFGQEVHQSGLLSGSGLGRLIALPTGILFFIDFLTLGFLKRNRWTAAAFYPIYRFVGWITLANLYRPLYHNLVDHRFGRRLARLLPVFVLLAMVAVSVQYVSGRFQPQYARDSHYAIAANNYDDTATNPATQFHRPTLRSKFPEHDYLELFIPYLPAINDPVIRKIAPALTETAYPGIKLRGGIYAGRMYNEEADYGATLAIMGRLHRVLLDSLALSVDPLFYFHGGREQHGLLYMIPTHQLPVGKHALRIESRTSSADTAAWSSYGNIYFYK